MEKTNWIWRREEITIKRRTREWQIRKNHGQIMETIIIRVSGDYRIFVFRCIEISRTLTYAGHLPR